MSDPAPLIPRSLFLFSTLYGGMTCIAGVLGNKLIAIGPLAVEGGIFAFLLLVVIASAVAEMHGRELANRMVRFGFLPMIVSMLLIRLMIALPPAAAMPADRLAAYVMILGQGARLMIAGLIAYGLSQMVNVTVFTALRGREGNRLLWLRAGLSSMASQVIDSLLFITIAFYGVFPIGGLIVGQILAKLLLSAVLVPPAVLLAVRIGRRLDAA